MFTTSNTNWARTLIPISKEQKWNVICIWKYALIVLWKYVISTGFGVPSHTHLIFPNLQSCQNQTLAGLPTKEFHENHIWKLCQTTIIKPNLTFSVSLISLLTQKQEQRTWKLVCGACIKSLLTSTRTWCIFSFILKGKYSDFGM